MKKFTVVFEGFVYSYEIVEAESLKEAYEKAREGLSKETPEKHTEPEDWNLIRVEDQETGEEIEVL